MARELPIQNGRLTTDLDANGHKIKNLPPGSGISQAQADWNQTDTTAPDYIKNKPAIPSPVTVDAALSPTSENPVQNKAVKAAVDGKRGLDDLAVYAEQYAWTFSDGVDHGVLIQDSIAAGWGVYPDRPWVVTGADFNTLPPSEYFFATKAEAEAVTEFSYYLMDGGDTIEITATRSTYVGPTQDTLAKTSEVTGKTDKVSSATSGNFAELDANGNLVDSGHKHSDYLTAHQSLAGLMPKYPFIAATVESGGLTVTPFTSAQYAAQSGDNFVVDVGALPQGVAAGTKVRDCILAIDATANTPSVTFGTDEAGAATFAPANGDNGNMACEAGAVNVYYISEYAPNAFLVARQVIGGGS